MNPFFEYLIRTKVAVSEYFTIHHQAISIQKLSILYLCRQARTRVRWRSPLVENWIVTQEIRELQEAWRKRCRLSLVGEKAANTKPHLPILSCYDCPLFLAIPCLTMAHWFPAQTSIVAHGSILSAIYFCFYAQYDINCSQMVFIRHFHPTPIISRWLRILQWRCRSLLNIAYLRNHAHGLNFFS